QARDLPLSVVGSEGFVDARSDEGGSASGRPATTEMSQRGRLELHSAGAPARRISYHLAAGFEKRARDLESRAAFLQLDDLVRGGGLRLRVGRFDVELPFLARTRRTTLADYLSPVTFDARGLELDGRRSSWTYAAGLALSDRHSSGGPSPTRIGNRLEDA